MFSKLPFLPTISLFFFFGCTVEEMDKLKGKKKEKSDPLVSYSLCLAMTQSCIDQSGEDCFIVRDNSHYFTENGGGAEKYCLDNLVETYLVTETGGM